jgi:hypothetical protein
MKIKIIILILTTSAVLSAEIPKVRLYNAATPNMTMDAIGLGTANYGDCSGNSKNKKKISNL